MRALGRGSPLVHRSHEPSIGFVRLPGLAGIEVMDVRGVSQQWATFHESYNFCAATPGDIGGEVAWRYRRRTHWMNVGRIQLLEPGEFHTTLGVAPPAYFRVVMIAPERMTAIARTLGWESEAPIHLRVADLGEGPIRRILRSIASTVVDERDPERADEEAHEFLALLSRHGCLDKAIRERPGKPSRRLALHARDLIHEHWAEPLPLHRVSADLEVSVPTLERAFGEAFGTTPKRYQNYVRLMRGKTLLASPEHSITTVSALCGFRDRKYFARLFRRVWGVTPDGYRSNVRASW